MLTRKEYTEEKNDLFNEWNIEMERFEKRTQ